MLRRSGCSSHSRACASALRAFSSKPYDPHRQWLTLSNDSQLAYTVEEPVDRSQDLPTVVCVHGAPGSVFDWRYLGPQLTSRGFRVVRLDQPGHGLTSRSCLAESGLYGDTEAMADVISEVCVKLKHVVGEKPVLLAHSLGGETAVTLAARSIDQDKTRLPLGGCALISPIGLRPHRALTWNNKRGINLATYMLPLFKSRMLEKVLAPLSWGLFVYFLGFPRRIAGEEYAWMWYRAAIINFEKQARRLAAIAEPGTRLPLCLFFGGHDPLMEPSVHEEVKRAWEERCGPLPQTKHRVVKFDEGTHYTIKSHADEIATNLHEWIVYSKHF